MNPTPKEQLNCPAQGPISVFVGIDWADAKHDIWPASADEFRMRAASRGETLIRSRSRKSGSAWSEHSIGLPATQWLEALRVSL